MPSIGSSLLPASALVSTPFTAIYNLTLSDTEYTITFPSGTKRFSLQARGQTTLKISESTGFTTTYWTVYPFNHFSEDSIQGNSALNIYVKSTKPNQILEVLYWT